MLYERMLQAKKNLGLEKKLIENEENLQVKEEVVIGQDYFDDNSSQSCLGDGIPREDPKSPNDLDPDSDVLSEGDINPDETEELVEQEFKEGLMCEEDPLCNVEILKENDNTSEEDIVSYVINFYKEHPEFVGRLFENGGLNPILTKLDFTKDKALAVLQQIGIDPGDALKAHDRYFQELAKTKKDEWNKEDVEHMKKIASQIIAEKDLFGGILGVPFSDTEMKESFKKFETPTIKKKEESMDRLQEMENPKEDTSGKTYSSVSKFLESYAEGNDVIQVLRKDLMAVLSDMQYILESKNTNEQWALDFADALNEISISI